MRFSVKDGRLTTLHRVFHRLTDNLPKAYRNIQIAVTASEITGVYKTYQGGYAVNSTIVVGTEFIDKWSKPHELASMLAHELAHHVLGHMNMKEEIHPQAEQDADHFSLFLCEMAGFKREDVIVHNEKFEKARQHTLTKQHIKEHGTGQDRVEKLKKQDEYLKDLGT
jgi:Peptidase family M48